MAKNIKLKIWRGGPTDGKLEEVSVEANEGEVVLDVIHRVQATQMGDLAVRWNCKAGKCGSCSMEINGKPRLACMTQVANFAEGETITVTPLRAFPVIKDLVVDRSAFDRIQQSGGFVSVNTSGNTIDANSIPIPKADADRAFDAATCIGCGACVATCKNSSAMLFVAAKVSQYALLPQGRVEATDRVLNMVAQMDAEGFGNCTNTGACEVECPKGISLDYIAQMNREYLSASLKG